MRGLNHILYDHVASVFDVRNMTYEEAVTVAQSDPTIFFPEVRVRSSVIELR
jgi:hypothetical protein